MVLYGIILYSIIYLIIYIYIHYIYIFAGHCFVPVPDHPVPGIGSMAVVTRVEPCSSY